MIRVTVDHDYDQHSLLVEESAFAQIQAGMPVTLKGQGFPVDGVMEQDWRVFNRGIVGVVHVTTDEGRDVFEVHIGDAEVVVSRVREG